MTNQGCLATLSWQRPKKEEPAVCRLPESMPSLATNGKGATTLLAYRDRMRARMSAHLARTRLESHSALRMIIIGDANSQGVFDTGPSLGPASWPRSIFASFEDDSRAAGIVPDGNAFERVEPPELTP